MIGEYHIGGILIFAGIILVTAIVTIRSLKHEQKCFRNYAKMIKQKELAKKKGGEEEKLGYTFVEDETEEETQEDRLERENEEDDELVEEIDFGFEEFTPM